MEASFDTWTTLFLVVAIHGVVLGTLFFFRSAGRRLPNRLLGVFLLLFSLNLISYVLYWTRYNLEFPYFAGIAGTFHFLYGPLIFFYALSILHPTRRLKMWDLVHLTPFVIYVIWMLPFFMQSAVQKAEMLAVFMNSTQTGISSVTLTIVAIKIMLMTGYGVAIFLLPRYAGRWADLPVNRLTETTQRWLKIAGGAFLGYVVSYALYFILVETINFQIEHDYMVSFAMSAFIFGIGYLGLIRPEYLEEAHNGKYKYENSSLQHRKADLYLKQLLHYMEKEKPYLDGDLKMNDLAEQLSIPSHHLSQIINERIGKNFFEFVNIYRIREVKQMLADPAKKDYKILRVAFEAGFNNKTTFNIAFKSDIGMTPSQYRKKYLEKPVTDLS